MAVLNRVAEMIARKFEVRIEKKVAKFLGMITEQDPVNHTVKLHSCTMIDQMIEKFEMINSKPAKTPLPEDLVLSTTMISADEGEKEKMSCTPYRQLVGCILHLANTTRPDIAFATGYLSRFMSEPGTAHWKAAKHVIRYLKETRDLGIVYEKGDGNTVDDLLGYSDSDFDDDLDKRKSTSGHCFIFAAGAVSCRSSVGRLVRVCFGCRPMLSIIYRTFQYVQVVTQKNIPLLNSVCSELTMMSRIALLSHVRLYRFTWSRIIAFDACNTGGAVSFTYKTRDLLQTLSCLSLSADIVPQKLRGLNGESQEPLNLLHRLIATHD